MAIDIVEALLFVDDSIEVGYNDGSFLQISSCGSVFRGQSQCSQSDGMKPSNKRDSTPCEEESQRLCQFPTTFWGEKVQLALDFRNKFAEVPYLCRHLFENNSMEKRNSIRPVCSWPGIINSNDNITKNQDGSLTLKSLEGNSTLTLSCSRQILTHAFLCQVQSEKNNPKEHGYSWVQQVFSVQFCPSYFDYPLKVLNNREMIEPTGSSDYTTLNLPLSLPLYCRKTHMHRWRSKNVLQERRVSNDFMGTESLKVYFSEGVYYRIFYTKYFIVEAILPDGSVVRSEGPTRLYYKHWCYDCDTTEVKENVYSIKALPLDKMSHARSISKIVRTSARILDYMSSRFNYNRYRSFVCCWKNEDDALFIENVSDSKVESCIFVPGEGTFKNYSNGRMQIIFSDGCIMGLMDPGGDHLNGRENHEIEKTHMMNTVKGFPENQDMFTILLPNGSRLRGSLKQPHLFERYVKSALEFIQWRHRQANKLQHLDESRLVVEELEKIQRFNNDNVVSRPLYERRRELDGAIPFQGNIAGAEQEIRLSVDTSDQLQKHLTYTRKTVEDIDLVLQNCKRNLAKKINNIDKC